MGVSTSNNSHYRPPVLDQTNKFKGDTQNNRYEEYSFCSRECSRIDSADDIFKVLLKKIRRRKSLLRFYHMQQQQGEFRKLYINKF